MRYFLFILLILSMAIVSFGIKLNIIHEWKYAEYEWDNQKQKENAISSSNYDPYKCYLYDVDKAEDGRVFVTAPKLLGPGSPATLATITNKTGPGGPLLRPYPDWSWHNGSRTCDGIISIFRVHIRCNHVFVLDSGKIGTDKICDPKLLIFDLKDDKLVETIYVPFNVAVNETGFGLLLEHFIYIPPYSSGKCEQFLSEMIVFMTDTLGNGLVVYDSSTKSMCRVESDYMTPTDNSFCVANQNYTYEGGIFGITILDDDLYYSPISGNEIYKIKITTLLECPDKEKANKQSKSVMKLSSHIGSMETVDHVIFYSNFLRMSVVGTNIYKKNTVELVQDSEKLQGATGIKYSPSWDQLIYLSDRFQRFYVNTVNLSEIHFRYFETDLEEIRKETDLFSRVSNEFRFLSLYFEYILTNILTYLQ